MRVDKLTVAGKEYDAYYYGAVDISSLNPDYKCREFWILQNAYADFKDCEYTAAILPYNNYPMEIRLCQVFVVKYTLADGTTYTEYYRSDDYERTIRFKVEE